MTAAVFIAGLALACTSNNTTVVIASPTTSGTETATPSLDQQAVDKVCAAITVTTGLVSKDLDLSPNKIQDAVNTDVGIFEGEIEPQAGQLGDSKIEAALSDLLYDSHNVTDFDGIGGSDEFISRLQMFAKTAQDFNRNYCRLF